VPKSSNEILVKERSNERSSPGKKSAKARILAWAEGV
jgi:hypothetical protein